MSAEEKLAFLAEEIRTSREHWEKQARAGACGSDPIKAGIIGGKIGLLADLQRLIESLA